MADLRSRESLPLRAVSLPALVLASLLFAPADLHAARMSYGEIDVVLDQEPRGQPSHGYTEYRFAVTNRGSRARRVTLVIPGISYSVRGTSSGLRSLSQSVEVAANSTSILALLQPALPDIPGNSMLVYIDGARQQDLFPLNPVASNNPGTHGHGRRGFRMVWTGRPTTNDLLVYSSARVSENFFRVPGIRGGMMMDMGGGMPGVGAAGVPGAIEPGPPPGFPPGGGVPGGGPPGGGVPMGPPGPPGMGMAPPIMEAFDAQFLRAATPVSLWSPNWLAYSRYDLIVLTRDDVEELDRGSPETRAVLAALHQYTEAGGALLLLGPGQIKLPAGWSKTVGKILGCEVYRPAFGVCIVAPDRDSSKWSRDRWHLVSSSASGTTMPWKATRSLIDLNQSFTIVDDLGVPVRGLFALMILFGIAIGPVNLVVLSRRNKRIWLLWTVPTLSAFFCLGIFGYMLAAEGWQGHSRVAGFTILDEAERRATTLGKAAFYCPMTPGDGLLFSDATEVQIQGSEHTAYNSGCSLEWRDGLQHLARGWVAARVPGHFALRRSESRRERLNIRKEGDAIQVINALGADIRSLTLADERGQIYSAGPIPAGSSATLTRQDKPRRGSLPLDAWRRVYNGGDWAVAIANAVKKPEELLGPGTYLAVLEESPFLEQPLRGAKIRPSESVILGLMAPSAEKP